MTEIIGRVGWRTYVSPLPTIWNNLVAYYRGDNTPNDSKGMYNGTFQRTSWGTPVSGATYSTGIIGNGFILDGTNDFVTLPNIPYTSTSLPFSFSCWFNLTKNGTLYDNIEGGTLKGWNIWMSNGNIFVRLASADYPTEIRTRTTNALSFNTMYHLTVSYSGNTNASGINIYINGALVSKTTQFNSCTVAALSPNSNYIGSGYFGTTGGLIDEVGIWDRALTAADATELYNGGAGKQYVAPTPAYTARTSAFATATGITDTTILNALNTFDTGLISNGLDTKMKAIYPFVGTTATTQKFNFMDARDLNAAFRLQFNGGITFTSNGIQFGGSNGYANTFVQPSTVLSLNDTHISLYSRTNNSSQVFDIQCTATPSLDIAMWGGTTFYNVNQALNYSTYSDGSTLGFRLINRTSSVSEKLFKNNSLVATVTNASTSLSPGVIDIGRYYFGGYYSNRNYAFISIGSGLTDGEATTFYNLVQAMQTSLSRQV